MYDTRPSLGWRVFSVATLVLTVPFETVQLFSFGSAYDTIRHLIHTIAAVGIFGYAFDIHLGAKPFWRIFAAVFTLFEAYLIAVVFSRLPALSLPSMGVWALASSAALFALATVVFMTLALFRYGKSPMPESVVFA